MPRTVDSTILTALLQDEVNIFYAIELDFFNGSTNASYPVRYWTGFGAKTLNSNTYNGAGNLLSISGLEEVSDLKATGVNVQLMGVPAALVTAALDYEYHGREATVYFGINGNSNLTEIFAGYMDQLKIIDGAESSIIDVSLESRLIDLDRIRPLRYTEEIQQDRFSGDTFFSLVQDLQDKKVNWGKE